MCKSLVLGDSGYLGKGIARALSIEGNQVLGISRTNKSSDGKGYTRKCIKNIKQEDLKDIRKVFICAGARAYNINKQNWEEQMAITREYTDSIKTLLKQNTTIIYLSSCQVYASYSKGDKNFKSSGYSDTFYAKSKIQTEEWLRENVEKHNLKILRIANTFGIDSIEDLEQYDTKTIIGHIILSLARKEEIMINSSNDSKRLYVHHKETIGEWWKNAFSN